ncbi:MAG: SprB repeat-containing protein, partial [Chitinophagales bacterium]|nr:SprB repeat-containing protein [Chitinophagales bacterium]
MKTHHFLLSSVFVCLLLPVLAFTQIIDDRQFVFLGADNEVLHLVWEEHLTESVVNYTVEKSYDGNTFFPLATVTPGAHLLDIHANDYPQDIEYNNNILYSTETGFGRFIYNDTRKPHEFAEKNFFYRVKMKKINEAVFYTRTVIKSYNLNIADFDETRLDTVQLEGGNPSNEYDNELPGSGPIIQKLITCPNQQNPPSGYIYTGNSRFLYGQCCYWEEKEYTNSQITEACGGMQAWCCPRDCAPVAYDPCCVHICSEYNLCSCPPWQCCDVSDASVWIVDTTISYLVSASIGSQTNVSCFGAYQDGVVNINVTGGFAPYDYVWDNGAGMGTNLNGLTAGIYTLTVSDDHGCKATTNFTITQPTQLITSLIPTHVSCNGYANGSIDLVVSGGTPNYTYSWSNTPTTQDIYNLPPNNYAVTVTDSKGCQSLANINIIQPGTFSGVVSSVNIPCNGWVIGSALITMTGGTYPYTYAWSNGSINQQITGLAAGSVSVTATDANGCTFSISGNVTQNTQISGTTSTTSTGCGLSTGTASVLNPITGGSGAYTFLWSPSGQTTQTANNLSAGIATVQIIDANVTPVGSCAVTLTVPISNSSGPTVNVTGSSISCSTSLTGTVSASYPSCPTCTIVWYNSSGTQIGTIATLNGLGPGTYTARVTRPADGCIISQNAIITANPPLSISLTIENESCVNFDDGSASATISGGTPTYIYEWLDSNNNIIQAGGVMIFGLPPANYSLRVTDGGGSGCPVTQSFTIVPYSFSISTTKTNPICSGGNTGTITVDVNGGDWPFTYQWLTNLNPLPNGTVIPSQNGQTLTGRSAGNYYARVITATNCTLTSPVPIVLANPPALTLSLPVETDILCVGQCTGGASVILGGGTPPRTLQWFDAGLVPIPGETNPSIDSLCAGTYYVRGADSKGCSSNQRTVSIINVEQEILFDIFPNNISCSGYSNGAINLTPYFGDPLDYNYLWNNGESTPNIAGLDSGTYTVTITDAFSGCTTTASAYVSEPDPLSVTALPYFYENGYHVTCRDYSNGRAISTIVGGTYPYTYLWSDPTSQQSPNAIGLAFDTYTITVTDANLCSATSTLVINLNPPKLGTLPTPLTYTGGWNVSCFDANDGFIDLQVYNGMPPYIYRWRTISDLTPISTSQDLTSAFAATFVSITSDSFGCNYADTITLTQPTPLLTSYTTGSFPNGFGVTCFGALNGSINLSVSGSTPGYDYAWSPGGATTQDLTSIGAGTYYVTVTDTNSCVALDTVQISSPSEIILSETHLGAGCSGDSSGSIDVTVSGGTPNYTYAWTNGAVTQDISNIQVGSYTLTVTDATGCTETITVTISSPGQIDLAEIHSDNPCFGDSSGLINVTTTGGTPPFDFDWSNGATTEDINGLAAGTYTLIVTDDSACLSTIQVTIDQPALHASTLNYTVCSTDTVFFPGGGFTTSNGTYLDTISANDGCDSSITINVTYFTPVPNTVLNVSLCPGDSIFAGGDFQTMPGTFYDTLTDGDGCDSIVQTQLNFFTLSPVTNLTVEICDGDSFFVGGAWQTATGIYNDTFADINGCDSIVATTLDFFPISAPTNLNPNICSGDSVFAGGAWQTTTGINLDTLTDANGCDSIVITNLTVLSSFAETVDTSICDGSSYFAGGSLQTTSGIYIDTLTAASGCDSIITTNLNVLLNTTGYVPVNICQGDTAFINGIPRTTTGIYFDTIPNAAGCDSVITFDLVVDSVLHTDLNFTLCDGDSVFAEGAWQFLTGSYFDTLTAANGCDSAITTNLTVLSHSAFTIDTSICAGDSYFAGGANQTASGTYYDTLIAANTCDSVVTTNLTILNTAADTIAVFICENDSILINGIYEYFPGIYSETFVAANSCDSVLTINLDWYPPASPNQVHVYICPGDSILIKGNYYFNGADIFDTLTNVNGCDSVEWITVNLLGSEIFVNNLGICLGDSVLINGIYVSDTGWHYVDTLTAANGCDSFYVLNLFYLPPHTPTFLSEIICGNDSFFVGGAWQNTSGVYFDTLTADNGCDSILSTTLDVLPAYLIPQDISICDGDSFFAGGDWQYFAGIYFDSLSAANGCDSIIRTNLTTLYITGGTTTVDFCAGDSVFVGGDWQTTSGFYYDTLVGQNQFGCDSILETTLLPLPVSSGTDSVSFCLGDSVFVGGDWQTTSGFYYDTLIGQNQYGCDSILETTLLPLPVSSGTNSVSFCLGDSVFVGGDWQTIPGFYYDTLVGQNQFGCDSILETTLLPLPVSSGTDSVSFCLGDSVFAGGNWQTNPGLYYDTLVGQNQFGCDSIVVTTLNQLPVVFTNLSVDFCEGDSIFVGGDWRTTPGVYYDTLAQLNPFACDSIIETTLNQLPVVTTNLSVDFCEGDSIFVGGDWQTTPGVYYDTLAQLNPFACDSVIETTLNQLPVFAEINPAAICDGDSFFAADAWQFASGNFNDTLLAANGCDSVVTTALTILLNTTGYVPLNICAGDTAIINGIPQTATGIYFDTIANAAGCDSILTFDLVVQTAILTDENITVCDGDSVFAEGAWQTVSGSYFDTLIAVDGCDSIITTNLNILSVFTFSQDISICAGDSFLTGGALQTASGTYNDTLTAGNGCDSVITTNLSVLPNSTFTQAVSICAGDSFFAGGAQQTTSGTYFDTLVAANSCDSVITTNLSILLHTSTIIDTNICDGESYIAGGLPQTTSGTYYDTLVAANGCDSVITTNLVVVLHAAFTQDISICSGDSFFAGGSYQNVDGIYFDTLVAANGCDSVITTNLSVLPALFTPVNEEICDGESFFAGGAAQTISGSYSDTLTSSTGCDSIVLTNLTVLPHAAFTQNFSICDGDSFLAGGALQSAPGAYFDTLPAANGCDSVITTNLSVLPALITTIDTTVCDGESVFAGGANQTISGTYYDTLAAASGCDSIVVTNLNVTPSSTTTIDTTICDGESVYAGGAFQTTSGTYYDTLPSFSPAYVGVDAFVMDFDSAFSYSVPTVFGSTYYVDISGTYSISAGEIWDAAFNFTGVPAPQANWEFNGQQDPRPSPDFYLVNHQYFYPFSGDGNLVTFEFADTNYSDNSGQLSFEVYRLDVSTGCDSIIVTNLTVLLNASSTADIAICNGDSFFVGGAFQNVDGTFFDTLTSANGCDSVVTTNLSVLPVLTSTADVAICNGDSFFVGGAFQTASG